MESQKMAKELEMAKRVQQGLLAFDLPVITGINVAKRCVPADSIGGDFYTFVNKQADVLAPKTQIPGVIRYVDTRESYFGVMIGDVAGHGVSSALVMALSSGILAEIGRANRDAATTLRLANDALIAYIENSDIAYVTVCYALIRLDSLSLDISRAGHPPAILLRKKTMTSLNPGGVFLGMFEDETYESQHVQLEPGDRLVLYTDGITEARNEVGEQLGLDRFMQLLLDTDALDAQLTVDTIFERVHQFANGVESADDQTLVIIDIGKKGV